MKDINYKKIAWSLRNSFRFLKWSIALPCIYILFKCVDFVLFGNSCYDFNIHWLNAKNLINGINIYDLSTFNQMSTISSKKYDLEPFDMIPRYFPSCYALLAPFALLNWPTAKCLWLIVSLFLTFSLAKEISDLFCYGKYFYFLLAALIFSEPWRANICFGQTAIWSFGFFILSIKFSGQKKFLFSGIALSLALLKYTLTGPLCLYFIVYKRVWKNVITALGIHFAIHFIISLKLHKSIFYLFMSTLKWCNNGIIEDGRFDFFRFWFLIEGKLSWVPFLGAGITLLIFLFFLYKKEKLPQDDLGVLALSSMVATVLTYHSESDFTVIVLPVAWILTRKHLDFSLVLFSVGIFFVGYLRGNYLPGDQASSISQSENITNSLINPNLSYFHQNLHTVIAIVYSLFWYLSILIMGHTLISKKNEELIEND